MTRRNPDPRPRIEKLRTKLRVFQMHSEADRDLIIRGLNSLKSNWDKGDEVRSFWAKNKKAKAS